MPSTVRVNLVFNTASGVCEFSTLVVTRDDGDPLADAVAQARDRARLVRGYDGHCEVTTRVLSEHCTLESVRPWRPVNSVLPRGTMKRSTPH